MKDLDWIIKEYGKDIYSFCFYLTNNIENADDLFQDTFLVVANKLDRLDVDKNVKSYLCGVAIKLWKNHERKRAWRSRIAPEVYNNLIEHDFEMTNEEKSYDEHDGLACVLDKEIKINVNRAVSSLKDKYKAVVLLYYMEELSVVEIANILRIPKGTVLSRLDTARKLLKSKLEGYFYED